MERTIGRDNSGSAKQANKLAPPHCTPHLEQKRLQEDFSSQRSSQGTCCIAMTTRQRGPLWIN